MKQWSSVDMIAIICPRKLLVADSYKTQAFVGKIM